MHRLRRRRHVAFGIYILVKMFAGWNVIDHFNTADFDNAVTRMRVKAGGFCIQDNFAGHND